MSYEELLLQLQYLRAEDIWERQQLIHQYYYANQIDLNILNEKPLKMFIIKS